ncbi:protein-export chaperone SecB [Porphyromonas levii]|nr:protein-export chaperone SecB [Porphyromonas levii]MBR8758996.1 Protein-export protein SecB [Porphyromonas levii]MBR8801759.1 Protein-export protein SecB [Porphyromonas levii]TFH94478.1 preprotein translocase subunit SecB [Porphyromonas levii]
MNIQLKNWQVLELNLNFDDYDKEDFGENRFELSYRVGRNKTESKEFIISFQVNLQGNNFNLDLSIRFFFVTDQNITDEFKKSDFVKINAPAIAFPYVRSYISNLTMQSGYETVVLPSINFVKLVNNNNNNIEE